MTTKDRQCYEWFYLPDPDSLCLSSVWTGIIILGLCVCACVCAVMPASLLWTLGYEERQAWRDDSVKTTCTVEGHAVDKTCILPNCWTGFIIAQHIILEPNYTYYRSWERVVNGHYNYQGALRQLDSKYPQGMAFTCYYRKTNPRSIRLSQPKTTVYLAFAIIFMIIACIILCVAVFIIPVVGFLCSYCCREGVEI